MIDNLTDANFIIYAAKHYDNPQCFDTVEFYEDLNRFKYIKRLLNKFKDTGELKDRLIFNHLTVLFNVFGTQACLRMLFLKLEGHHQEILPFLDTMECLPDVIEKVGIRGMDITVKDVHRNKEVEFILKKKIDD